VPSGFPIVWTKAIDRVLLRHAAREAAVRLGLPLRAVQVRRRQLADRGRTLAVRSPHGR
jgi:hypothetical protein